MSKNKIIFIYFLLFLKIINCQTLGRKCFHRKNNVQGTCVRINKCDGIERDLRRNILPQFCPGTGRRGSNLVCCPRTNTNTRISEKNCQKYLGMLQNYWNSIDPNDRIVNGTSAKRGEFPHFAELGYGSYPYKWQCGGSLISEKFVLTAAHCISETNPVTAIQMGDIYLDSEENMVFEVERSIKYPGYQKGSPYNDLTLVELRYPIEFTNYIRPACLPNSEELPQKLIASGFGFLDFTDFSNSKILQKVTLEYFPTNLCSRILRNKSPKRFEQGVLESLQICYGGQDSRDTCKGDSGGPLQFVDYDPSSFQYIYRIIGVVSTGFRCGVQGIPGIYTRVFNYLPWIEKVVWG